MPTWQGWLYLATVIDIASRRVVGFATADHLRTELVAGALTNAVADRHPATGVIFHSDRGCQYTSAQFAAVADDCAVTLSVGRTGQCWDNALAESFFASLKGECLDQQPWPTRAAARRAIVEYIGWFNGTPPAQRVRLPDTYRVRSSHPTGDHREGSLTEPSALSVKTGQPHGRQRQYVSNASHGRQECAVRLTSLAALPRASPSKSINQVRCRRPPEPSSRDGAPKEATLFQIEKILPSSLPGHTMAGAM